MNYKVNDIQLFDLSTSTNINKKYVAGVKKIINNSDFILGEEVTKFENNFTKFIGSKYSIGLNSGTDSLEIALRLLNIGEGDEVIVPSFSFFATSETVLKVGAQPIYCDINLNDLTLDTNKLMNLITTKTKAIIPVHLFGNACDMNSIKNIIGLESIKIIEDVAQAFGSKYNNSYLGTIGEFGCFSFYPTKNLGAWGDGGLISFNLKKYLKDAKSLRNHGATKRYYHEKIGLNSRLDTTQALILNIKLQEFKKNIEKRKKNVLKYSNKLNQEVFNMHFQNFQPLNVVPVSVKNQKILKKVQSNLERHKISYGSYYPYGLHEFPVSKLTQKNNTFENTDMIKKRIITLPCHPSLTNLQIEKSINILNIV